MTLTWELSYAVETDASPAIVWSYWSNVANWSDPPAEFELEGPPMHWRIPDVLAPETGTIEFDLGGATLWIIWQFDPIDGGRTRLTQRLELRNENAGGHIVGMEAAFRENLAPGMRRIAALMEDFERRG